MREALTILQRQVDYEKVEEHLGTLVHFFGERLGESDLDTVAFLTGQEIHPEMAEFTRDIMRLGKALQSLGRTRENVHLMDLETVPINAYDAAQVLVRDRLDLVPKISNTARALRERGRVEERVEIAPIEPDENLTARGITDAIMKDYENTKRMQELLRHINALQDEQAVEDTQPIPDETSLQVSVEKIPQEPPSEAILGDIRYYAKLPNSKLQKWWKRPFMARKLRTLELANESMAGNEHAIVLGADDTLSIVDDAEIRAELSQDPKRLAKIAELAPGFTWEDVADSNGFMVTNLGTTVNYSGVRNKFTVDQKVTIVPLGEPYVPEPVVQSEEIEEESLSEFSQKLRTERDGSIMPEREKVVRREDRLEMGEVLQVVRLIPDRLGRTKIEVSGVVMPSKDYPFVITQDGRLTVAQEPEIRHHLASDPEKYLKPFAKIVPGIGRVGVGESGGYTEEELEKLWEHVQKYGFEVVGTIPLHRNQEATNPSDPQFFLRDKMSHEDEPLKIKIVPFKSSNANQEATTAESLPS